MLISVPRALRIATACLLLAISTGCSKSRETFASERKAEAVGFRLEHFEREKLLFVHRPDGQKDGVDLGALRRVFLHSIKAKDSNDGKPKFWWQFESGTRIVAAPFFGTEPSTVVGILASDLSGFDQASAMRMVSAFEKDRASYCLVWASPEYLAETGTKVQAECR